MNSYLLFPDRDPDLSAELPPNAEALRDDLGLEHVVRAMSDDDPFLEDVAWRVILRSEIDLSVIDHRQRIIADCLACQDVLREIYATVVSAIEDSRKLRFGLFPGGSANMILHTAVNLLEFLIEMLMRLRRIATNEGARFTSPGFTRFFAMLRSELDDAYFERIAEQLAFLRFRDGVVMSARLGAGNKGVDLVMRRGRDHGNWWRRLAARRDARASSFEVDTRDEAGARTLDEIRTRGLNPVANALAQSAEHILSFLGAVRAELAFYVGCVRLHERLADRGEPTCFPAALPLADGGLSARGLYDLSLSLLLDHRAVANDLDATDRPLVVVTGANQGGKSTFLRSLGTAYLLMQAGMFVPAVELRAGVRDGIFTHFKREEDRAMESGKLDEELTRMSDIVGSIRPGALLLCNESFSSTNEREGSELARQVTEALLEHPTRIVFVTHLHDFARSMQERNATRTLFLRAERRPDGTRTFRVVPGEPLSTSYARDVFEQVFHGAESRT